MLAAALNVPSTYQLVLLASTFLPDSLMKTRSLFAMGVMSLGTIVSLRTRKGCLSVVLVSRTGKDSRSSKDYGLGG